ILQDYILYKEIFPLLKDSKLWIGYNSGGMNFKVPDDYQESQSVYIKDGEKWQNVGAIWYTNLAISKQHEDLILYKEYNPEEYPKYDNYDAINVGRTKNIPMDYKGEMGVPITFMNKYNPEQFEIIKFRKGDDDKDLSINGKCPFFRIIIKNKKI
ncbi:MAG: adenine-specific methyltransferase EcoRI family protein, partial [Proteobacteria bacterium]|nr:adenine-specific methyltransferase EcoRI family protein [Pseudomonadota bacterium]